MYFCFLFCLPFFLIANSILSFNHAVQHVVYFGPVYQPIKERLIVTFNGIAQKIKPCE